MRSSEPQHRWHARSLRPAERTSTISSSKVRRDVEEPRVKIGDDDRGTPGVVRGRSVDRSSRHEGLRTVDVRYTLLLANSVGPYGSRRLGPAAVFGSGRSIRWLSVIANGSMIERSAGCSATLRSRSTMSSHAVVPGDAVGVAATRSSRCSTPRTRTSETPRRRRARFVAHARCTRDHRLPQRGTDR